MSTCFAYNLAEKRTSSNSDSKIQRCSTSSSFQVMFSGVKDSEFDSSFGISFDGKSRPPLLVGVGLSQSGELQDRIVNVVKIFTPILIEIHVLWIINEVLSYCFLAYLGCKLCSDIAKGEDCNQKRKSDAHGPSYLTEQCFAKHTPMQSLQKLSGMLKIFLPGDASSMTKNHDLSGFEKQFKASTKIHYYGMTHGNEKQSNEHEKGSTTKKENQPSTTSASGNAGGASPNLSGARVSNGNGGSSGGGGDDEGKGNEKKIPQDAPDFIPDVGKNNAEEDNNEETSTTEITAMLANFSFKIPQDEKPPLEPCQDRPMDISPAFAVASIVERRGDSVDFDYAFSEEQQFFSAEYQNDVFAAAMSHEEDGPNGTRVVPSGSCMSVDGKDDDDNASYFSDTTSSGSQESICIEGTQYNLREVLGRGAFGICRIAVDVNSGKLYAVKVITQDMFDKTEIGVMKKLNVSPYIVHYHGHVCYNDKVCLLMAYAQGGTLQGFLRHMQGLNVKTVTDFFHGIISGIAFMHSQNIIHADLKSENILLMSSDNSGHYRPIICDFGLAIDLTSAESVNAAAHGRGTIRYRSPELCRGRVMNTFSSDIWSTGCVLVEMDTGDPPWKEAAQRGDPALVYTIGSAREPPVPEDGSPFLMSFYEATLAIEPENRATALEIINALDIGTENGR